MNKINQKNTWRTFALAWPVMLSNITIPLLGMVDIAVVGHDYPAHVLGAVAVGSMVFDVLFLLFGFLRMSTTGLVAQAPKDATLFYRALLTACSIAFLLIIFQKLIFTCILVMIDVSTGVASSLRDYFFIRIYASPVTLGNFVLLGYFFGRQNTKAPLVLLILTNITAITLDFILVHILNLGVKGLAVANIAAQGLGFFVGLKWAYVLFKPRLNNFSELFDLEAVRRLFHVNKDIFIRTLCLMGTFAYFTAAGSRLGTTIVAANAILLSMHHFMAYGLDGFAIASEVLVGRAIGQKDRAAFNEAMKTCGYFSCGIAVISSLFYWLMGGYIIALMSSLPQVVLIAKQYMLWVVLLPICSVAGFLFDGIFIGATWSRSMRNAMLFSTLLVYFPCVFLMRSYGNTGLWAAFTCFMLARGISLGVVLHQKIKARALF